MQLFGFLTEEELSTFKMLIGVSGVGPKMALAILSSLTPEEFAMSVVTQDSKAITAAHGVGKKLAEKIIIELKDKLKLEDAIACGQDNHINAGTFSGDSQIVGEAVEALTALGYSQTEALKAVKASDTSICTTAEDVIKLALKNM